MKPALIRKLVAASLHTAIAVSPLALAQPAATSDAITASALAPQVGQAGKDVIWVPTNQALVDRMLDLAKLSAQDRLVDLGSGDGRLVITAARRGAAARGIEFNPDLVALARRTADREGVGGSVSFEQADIFTSDFKDATVVTLFLLPELNLRLRPTLLAMEPGTRIVSNSFTMGEWKPDETVQVTEGCTDYCVAHKWVVPAQVAGTWRLANQKLALRQQFQMLSGSLEQNGTTLPITAGRVDGEQIRFNVGGSATSVRSPVRRCAERWTVRRLGPQCADRAETSSTD